MLAVHVSKIKIALFVFSRCTWNPVVHWKWAISKWLPIRSKTA